MNPRTRRPTQRSPTRLLAEEHRDALAMMERAVRLSPRAHVAALACAQFCAAHYEGALVSARRTLQAYPSYAFARAVACASAFLIGDRGGAQDELARLRREQPRFHAEDLRRNFGERRILAVDRLVDAVNAVERGA